MPPPRRVQRRETTNANERTCKCYDGRSKTFPRKIVPDDDDQIGKVLKLKRGKEFVFESNGDRIDAATSVERHKLQVVLLDINVNPRFQQNCKQCGLQVPASKLVYQFPSKELRGRKRSRSGVVDAGVEDKTLQPRRSGRKSMAKKKDGPDGPASRRQSWNQTGVNANDMNGNLHQCNVCSKSFASRKARNMHQLEHAENESTSLRSSSKRGRGRPQGKVLIRKKVKTKGFPQRSHARSDSDLLHSSRWSINDKYLTIQLPDIRARLRVVVDKDGKRRHVLKD